jgi:hypothetical protein
MRCVSMLLFLLCACANARGASAGVAVSSPFSEPSAVLLNPWVPGDVSAMGLAAVSPVGDAFAAAVSIRGAIAGASGPRA